MENWGLITYRTTDILFDDNRSDAKYKTRIAYVVAHGKLIQRNVVVEMIAAFPRSIQHWTYDLYTYVPNLRYFGPFGSSDQ